MKPTFWLRALSAAGLLTLQTLAIDAQDHCQFYDDYSTSNGWTQVGADVAVNNGVVEYQNGASGSVQRRVHKPIGTTLTANTTWIAEFEFTPQSVGNYGGPHAGHALLSLTAGTQEPFNDCPDVACTGYPMPTQDGISCTYGGPSNPSDGNVYLYITTTDGATGQTPFSALIPANTMSVTYYIRLERINSTLVELGVFSDPGRSNHIPGSPVSMAIPSYIGNLNTLQHGNIARGGAYRELTGTVDNVCLKWETPCHFYDDYSTNSGWTQVGALVAVNNGTVEFQNGSPGSVQRRVHKPIGTTLAANTTWIAEFEFSPQSVGNYGGPHAAHSLLSLTAGTQEPFNDCPDVACTGYPAPTQDGISCTYGGPSNPSDGNVYLYITTTDGSTGQTPFSALIPANIMGAIYYIRLERISSTLVELGVFSDPGRSAHIPGSPVSMAIPSYIGNLTTIQHGTIARGGPYRELTGTVDNVCLKWETPCRFYDDYSTNNGWTQVGALVAVNNGTVEFQNGSPGSVQRRVHKPIGTTLAANTTWIAEFEFSPQSVGNYGGPHAAHSLLSLTAGTQEPFNDCPDVFCTGYPAPTQDGISCVYGGPSNPSDGNVYFYIITIDGATQQTPFSALIPANTMGVTYYIRLERTSSTSVVLGVFSDPGRSNHIPGSPVNMAIPSYIGNLTTIQHGTIARGGPYRELTGTVDNVCLRFDATSDSEQPTAQTPTPVQVYPNPTSAGVTITGSFECLNSLRILDITGRWVQEIPIQESSNTYEVPLTNLQPGAYILTGFDCSGKVFSKQIVKMR